MDIVSVFNWLGEKREADGNNRRVEKGVRYGGQRGIMEGFGSKGN